MIELHLSSLDQVKLATKTKKEKLLKLMTFLKPLALPNADPCPSAKISGIFLMKFNGSLIEVYCEVEPNQENKWLVTINFLFNKTSKFEFILF